MSESQEPSEGFTQILEFLETNLSFESRYYNNSYIDRRLRARMRRTDFETYDGYLSCLEESSEEQELLVDSLSINVTSFFRNPEVWNDVRSILRDLSEDQRTVRVWSAPCADGREPYSIAMLVLDDPQIDEQRFEILGTDLNDAILETAERGEYKTSATTDIEEELSPLESYEAYIERDGGHFCVRENVKDLVTFEQHDLIGGASGSDWDIVVCRNLLIYIDEDMKPPIFETVTNSLRDGGFLVIGMTETLTSEFRNVYEPVQKRHRIYRKVDSD